MISLVCLYLLISPSFLYCSLCLFVSLFLILPVSHSLCPSIFLCLSPCLSKCLSVFVSSLSLALCPSLFVCLSLSLSVSLFVSLCLSLSLSVFSFFFLLSLSAPYDVVYACLSM